MKGGYLIRKWVKYKLSDLLELRFGRDCKTLSDGYILEIEVLNSFDDEINLFCNQVRIQKVFVLTFFRQYLYKGIQSIWEVERQPEFMSYEVWVK